MNPKVSIIILNWNGWEDTIECLESLYQITYPNYDVVVVDNGSEDESVQKIRDYCEGEIEVGSKFFEYSSENKPIKIIEYTREEAEAGGGKEKGIEGVSSNGKVILIKNEENYGFAEGNNIAIRYALKMGTDYILLLNNDTVVDKMFLGELVKVGENDEKIGIVGPKIYYYDEPNKITFIGGNINLYSGKISHPYLNKVDRGQFAGEKEIDYISGCGLLIKRRVINEIGLMDPSYFLYYEDTDWCLRAKRRGYKIMFIPKARIWHKLSASIEVNSLLPLYYGTRNKFLFMKKNCGFKEGCFFFPRFFLCTLPSSFFFALLDGKRKAATLILYALYDIIKGNYGYQKRC